MAAFFCHFRLPAAETDAKLEKSSADLATVKM